MERTDLSQDVTDGTSAAMFVLDRRGCVVSWNRAAVALTGVPAREIVGKSFTTQLLLPEDIAQWMTQFDRIAEGKPVIRPETRWRIPDAFSDAALSPRSLLHASLLPASMDTHSLFRNSAGDVAGFVSRVEDDSGKEFRDTSRYLHDTVSQTLVEISFRVSRLQTATRDLPCAGEAGAALEAIHRCCRQIRLLGLTMAPPPPATGDVAGAIERYADDVRREADVPIAVQCDRAVTVPADVEYLMLAAVREWLRRAVLNGGKTGLAIHLVNGDAGPELELKSVADPCLAEGWACIRERAGRLGGRFEISNGSGEVCARMSLPKAVLA